MAQRSVDLQPARGLKCPVCYKVVPDQMKTHILTAHGQSALDKFARDSPPEEVDKQNLRLCTVCHKHLHRSSLPRHMRNVHALPYTATPNQSLADVSFGSTVDVGAMTSGVRRTSTPTHDAEGSASTGVPRGEADVTHRGRANQFTAPGTHLRAAEQSNVEESSVKYTMEQVRTAVQRMVDHGDATSYTEQKVKAIAEETLPNVPTVYRDMMTMAIVTTAQRVANLHYYAAAFRDQTRVVEYRRTLEQLATLARGPSAEVKVKELSTSVVANVPRPTTAFVPFQPIRLPSPILSTSSPILTGAPQFMAESRSSKLAASHMNPPDSRQPPKQPASSLSHHVTTNKVLEAREQRQKVQDIRTDLWLHAQKDLESDGSPLDVSESLISPKNADTKQRLPDLGQRKAVAGRLNLPPKPQVSVHSPLMSDKRKNPAPDALTIPVASSSTSSDDSTPIPDTPDVTLSSKVKGTVVQEKNKEKVSEKKGSKPCEVKLYDKAGSDTTVEYRSRSPLSSIANGSDDAVRRKAGNQRAKKEDTILVSEPEEGELISDSDEGSEDESVLSTQY